MTPSTRHSRSQSHTQMEPLKERVKAYTEYCLHSLKKPDDVLESEKDKFGQGVTTILLFIVLLGFAHYGLNTSQSTLQHSIVDSFLFIGMSILIAIASVFIINKLFGPGLDNKEVVGLYGAYLVPFAALALLALLLLILNAFSISLFLLTLSILYALIFLPLYLLIRLLSRHSSHLEPHYSFMAYLILVSSLLSLYVNIALDASILKILLWLNQL